jgi:hypothetical protein
MDQTRGRSEIKVEFGFSTSPNYEKAVEIARGLSGYASWGEGRKLKHQVTLGVADEVEEFLRLSALVREWKSTVFWLNEKDMGRWGPFRLLYCIRDRLNDYKPSTYCGQDNYWGCHLLRGSLITGHFDENGAFHFDKARFLFEEKEELEILAACPFFDRDIAMQRLEELDEVIDPRTSEKWDYYRDFSDTIRGVVFIPSPEEVEFATLEERGEKAWNTRIITIPHEQWVEYAIQGRIHEVDILLEQGWRLVTVVEHDEVWYCVLQR